MTMERLEALHAVKAGTVTARLISAPGSSFCFEPREMQVSAGFLMKAGMIQRDGKTVELTERGERYIAESRNTA